jgi:uncharacterized protein (DUF2147 family)
MKRLLLSIVAATAFCAPRIAFASEIYGVWVREGHPTDKLEFYDCQGKLCAKGVLPMLDGSPPPVVLRHAAKTGPNSWKGDLFNPEDGKTYTGKITYETPNQLTLTGCLVAFLCQSETWTRISGPTKPAPPPDAKTDSKGDVKGEGKSDPKAAKAPPAADSAKAGDKSTAEKGAASARAAAGAAKAAKAAEPKSVAPAKPAPAKPAPKPAPDPQ